MDYAKAKESSTMRGGGNVRIERAGGGSVASAASAGMGGIRRGSIDVDCGSIVGASVGVVGGVDDCQHTTVSAPAILLAGSSRATYSSSAGTATASTTYNSSSSSSSSPASSASMADLTNLWDSASAAAHYSSSTSGIRSRYSLPAMSAAALPPVVNIGDDNIIIRRAIQHQEQLLNDAQNSVHGASLSSGTAATGGEASKPLPQQVVNVDRVHHQQQLLNDAQDVHTSSVADADNNGLNINSAQDVHSDSSGTTTAVSGSGEEAEPLPLQDNDDGNDSSEQPPLPQQEQEEHPSQADEGRATHQRGEDNNSNTHANEEQPTAENCNYDNEEQIFLDAHVELVSSPSNVSLSQSEAPPYLASSAVADPDPTDPTNCSSSSSEDREAESEQNNDEDEDEAGRRGSNVSEVSQICGVPVARPVTSEQTEAEANMEDPLLITRGSASADALGYEDAEDTSTDPSSSAHPMNDPSTHTLPAHLQHLGLNVVIATMENSHRSGNTNNGDEGGEDLEQGRTSYNSQSTTKSDSDTTSPPWRRNKRFILGGMLVFIVAIAGVVGVMIGKGGGGQPPPQEEHDEGGEQNHDNVDIRNITTIENMDGSDSNIILDQEEGEETPSSLAPQSSPITSTFAPTGPISEERKILLELLDPFMQSVPSGNLQVHRIEGSPQHMALNWLESTTNFMSEDGIDLMNLWTITTTETTANDRIPIDLDMMGEATQQTRDVLTQRYILATLYYSTGGVMEEVQQPSPSSSSSVLQEDETTKSQGSSLVTEKNIFDDNEDEGSEEGGGWINRANFLSPALHHCEWFTSLAPPSSSSSSKDTNLGVTCDEEQNIIELKLPSNGLRGTLPEELAGLQSLLKLDVSSNKQIGGTLPLGLGQLRNLKTLNLSQNSIGGTFPSSYGTNLSELQELDLSNNILTGSIPPTVSKLTSLSSIFMSLNKFTAGMDEFCSAPGAERRRRTFYADCYCRNFPRMEPEVDCSCCSMCCLGEYPHESCHPNVPSLCT